MKRFPNIPAGVWAILAIVGLAAASIIAVRADEEREFTQSGGAPAPVGTPPPTPAPAATAQIAYCAHAKEPDNLYSDVTDLTEKRIEEVKSLLSSDPSLNSLLAGESYTIQNMSAWVSYGEDRKFIGARVCITLDSPVSYDGYLPIVESFERLEDGSGELYVDSGAPYELQAEGIASLAILVDLNKGKVVDIDVNKTASENAEHVYMEYIHNLRRYIDGG